MRKPSPGAKTIILFVEPTQPHLDMAIADLGFCDPRRCFFRVTTHAAMDLLVPGENHHVRVGNGHIKLIYKGWRYWADMPRYVVKVMMIFDKLKDHPELINKIRLRPFKLRLERKSKVRPNSEGRKARINAARHARIAAGSQERHKKYDFHSRVVGLSTAA